MTQTLLYGLIVVCGCSMVALYPLWNALDRKFELGSSLIPIPSKVTASTPIHPIGIIVKNLSRMGWKVTERVMWSAFAVIFGVVTFVVLAAGDPLLIAIFMSAVTCAFVYTAILFYSRNFERRFEKGLFRALKIGIDALDAVNKIELAISDIVKYSRDPVIRREFRTVMSIWENSPESMSSILISRSQLLNVESYRNLAILSEAVEPYGGRLVEVWRDVQKMIKKQFIYERKKAVVTAMTRYGGYIFGFCATIVFVLMYHQIAPALQGGMIFIFLFVVALVLTGIILLARI